MFLLIYFSINSTDDVLGNDSIKMKWVNPWVRGAFVGSQECKIPLQWDNVEESGIAPR